MAFSISKFAAKSGVSASAVRYYESVGLLPRAERRSGRRVYFARDVPALRLIVALRQAGFSIAEIGEFLASTSSDRTSPVANSVKLRAKARDIDDRIRALDSQRKLLELALACPCHQPAHCNQLREFLFKSGERSA